ncbi:uncharacterized protein LOC102802218 [Saccoglossus kowalevskii]|uniref:Leucine-rich repeat and IQ domain-containing protein 4-like n=1 Tax=Saccoglossus kowalevskii TaxID=10224 RepID=A0ABM0MZZ2_SACKO|nr:PREDICTED: leucine-rich repeat and IQ domain-containing protein 4-like [Saccoglossus kowalevskii]
MNLHTYLDPGLVDSHAHLIKFVPLSWNVMSKPPFYFLDLKMCQIASLAYNFKFGEESVLSPRSANIIEQPSKCLKLDLSLNDLSVLDNESLFPFKECRHLDVSLNRLERFTGIEVMTHLVFINLSHNFIRKLEGLDNCKDLEELNLGMNELRTLNGLPALRSITVLHLNNNVLESLNGLQALPKLQELYVQKNRLRDLKSVASSFNLMILDASDNKISDSHHTIAILRGLRRLTELHLYGNPMQKENHYKENLFHSTTVQILDGLTLRSPYQPPPEVAVEHFGKVNGLKAAARRAYQEQLHFHKREADETIKFLQKRIMSIKEQHGDYEQRMKRDLNACLRYLDHVSSDDVYRIDDSYLQDTAFKPYIPKPWTREPRHLPRGDDYLNNAFPRRHRREAPLDTPTDRERRYDLFPDDYETSQLIVPRGNYHRGLKRADDVLVAAAERLKRDKNVSGAHMAALDEI